MRRKGPIPTAVWIAVIALGVIGGDFMILGIARGDPFEAASGVGCALLAWTLASRIRWAQALTLIGIGAGLVTLVLHGREPQALVALVITACVWIPLLVHWRWFWEARPYKRSPVPKG